MFSSCAWRPSTSFSSDAVTSSRTTWMDVVADDPLGGREVADAHPDDPAVDLRQRRVAAPLLDVRCHRDVLGLPVVGLHRPVQLVRPAVPQRQQVERHRLAAADDALGRERGLRLGLVEDERPGADRVGLLHRSNSFGSTAEEANRQPSERQHGPSFFRGRFRRRGSRRPGSSPDPARGALPLRDSAGITPDFAGNHDTPLSRGRQRLPRPADDTLTSPSSPIAGSPDPARRPDAAGARAGIRPPRAVAPAVSNTQLHRP